MVQKRAIISLVLFFSMSTVIFAESLDHAFEFDKVEEEHTTYSSGVCISTNTLGDIAIGFSDNYINVYDKSGKFKYCYTFEFNGSYAFEFDSFGNIKFSPTRSDSLYWFNENAQLVNIIRKEDDTSGIEKYHFSLFEDDYISSKDNKYHLKNTLLYTKLIKEEGNGNETIIYSTDSFVITRIIICLFLVFFVFLVVIGVIKEVKKAQLNQQREI